MWVIYSDRVTFLQPHIFLFIVWNRTLNRFQFPLMIYLLFILSVSKSKGFHYVTFTCICMSDNLNDFNDKVITLEYSSKFPVTLHASVNVVMERLHQKAEK